jgi:putative nucleotidyltransferase with HDIG domain
MMSPDTPEKRELRQRVKDRIAARVRAGHLEVPVLPHVAARVLALTNDPNVAARDFVALIEQDQQLAARLLKIANSPVYAGPFQVSSIQRAVVVVGMNTLRDLVFSVALGEKIFRSKRFAEPMARVWQHSLATALIAQEIAKARQLNVENAFLAGLLHDIGKPLLLETLEQAAKELHALDDCTEAFIDEVLRDYHPAVGGLMAKAWRFSEPLYEAIRHHHAIAEAPNERTLVALVHVANLFAHALGIASYSLETPPDLLAEPGLRELALQDADIVALLEKLPKITHGTLASFQ